MKSWTMWLQYAHQFVELLILWEEGPHFVPPALPDLEIIYFRLLPTTQAVSSGLCTCKHTTNISCAVSKNGGATRNWWLFRAYLNRRSVKLFRLITRKNIFPIIRHVHPHCVKQGKRRSRMSESLITLCEELQPLGSSFTPQLASGCC